ncbi:hypothetical protein [Nocardia farcinica]|uniref:hypothetical protein n=1 Tax=Nocardia farcinica TaxID=37329 RepID=UPI001E56A5A2|nr:hypothetical protein [Nocardia farcinica]
MAVARSAGPALITSAEAEFAEIIRWYEDQLETTAPPVDLEYEPVKIGPVWQWDNGWRLPELTLGWRVLAWCGKWLRDKKGQPWQFTPEQTRFLLWYFAIDEHGDFLYHSAVLQRLKGWGKDPMAACLSSAACFAEVAFEGWRNGRPIGREEPAAWVQIIAVSQEQTKNTMKLFPSLIPPETRRHYGIQIGKLNVYGLGDTRQIEAVTSSPLAIEGGRPTQVVRAETQNWNASNGGHDMAGALEGNAAKAEMGAPARMLDICNAYRPGEDSVGERVREAYEATLGEGATAMDFGLLYDSLEAPPEAPLTAEDAPAVVHSIRGDSYWLDTRPNGRIIKSILNPANPPSESRRKWYNQVVATADAWTTPQLWDRLADPTVVPPNGAEVFLFLDGSKSDDSTALIGCDLATGDVFTPGIWERPANHDSKRAWIVDRADVDGRVRWACARWDVLGLWCDPSDARDDESGELFWEPLCDDWAAMQDWRLPAVRAGDRAHPIIWDMRSPRHAALHTEHAERTVTDIKDGAFRHDGHRRLRAHVHNARRRPGKYGVGLGKSARGSAKKVDAAVAMVGARLMRKLWLLAHPDGPNEAFFL